MRPRIVLLGCLTLLACGRAAARPPPPAAGFGPTTELGARPLALRPKAWSGSPAANSRWAPPIRAAIRRRPRCGSPTPGRSIASTVDGFWMDRTEVTNAQFAAFVARDRLRDGRRAHADAPRTSPARRPRTSSPARSSSPPPDRRCRSTTTTAGGAMCTGASWRHPLGPGERSGGPRRLSRRARRLRRRRGVRALGGQAAADRGRVRVRGARRA